MKSTKMMRGDWRDMRIGSLQQRLHAAENDIARLEQKNQALKQIITDMCELFDLDAPDFRFARYVPKASAHRYDSLEEEDPEDVTTTEPALEEQLLTEMLMNSQRTTRRHSAEAKKFYSIVYLQGSTAYTALSRVLPLPSVKTIQRVLKPQVETIQDKIEAIEKTRLIFHEIREKWGEAALIGTLAVDACSHSTCSNPGSPRRGETSQVECVPSHYCFAFYYQPMNAAIPCTVVHVTTERTGKANEKHRRILHDISNMAKAERFIIVMLCSDGDSAYMPETSLSNTYLQSQTPGSFVDIPFLKKLGEKLRKAGVQLFGADMLHILKNARARMLREDVSMNLRQPVKLSIQAIKCLDIPSSCFCNTDLNKMVDSFPLAIFTLENAKELFLKNSVHESIFLLWFALFHAFFRGICSLGTRLRMGLCFLHLSNLYTNYFNTTVKKHVCMCGEYRRRGGGCVTAFPIKHIERMTVTVSTVMGMILTATKGDEIALNRFSTHPLENFFGQLRVLCRFKHSYDNILKKAAQTVVIKQGKRDLGISDWIAKRVNVAGQRVVIPMNDISVNESEIVKLCQSIMFFVDSLYVTEFLGNVSSEDEHKERVLSFLEDISYVTLPHVNLIGDYSGQQILTRLICNSRAASQEQSDQSAQLGEKQVSSPV